VNHAEQARALVALGFPALEDRMAEVFAWLPDSNCPASPIVAEFLRSVGRPLIPHVRAVLRGGDPDLKHAVLTDVVGDWPDDWVAELLPELRRWPEWEDHMVFTMKALPLVAERRLEDPQTLREHLRLLKEGLAEYRGEIEKIERGLPEGA
jgi:hypothetical protein